MARIRSVKPEFFKHEELAEAEFDTKLPVRLAFAGLWTQADREGRFAWRPARLKTDVLPYDDVDFARVLHALEQVGVIRRYEVDGKTYGCIPSFKEHQVINHAEAKSKLPPPPDDPGGASPVITGGPQPSPEGTGDSLCGMGREGKGTGRERELEGNGGAGGEPPVIAPDPLPLEEEPVDSEATFAGFWEACPNKEGKKAAEKAWAKARDSIAREKGISRIEAARWLTGRMRTFATTPKGQAGKFCPMPATWLNQGRYDDDDEVWQDRDRTSRGGGSDPRGNFASASRAIENLNGGALAFPTGDRGPPLLGTNAG